jgi:ubiquinone biosynthesis protein UbiJ
MCRWLGKENTPSANDSFSGVLCLQSLARTMVDKSHFLLDQREALEHSAGDHLTTKSEATKAHARVASFQDAHNTLVDAVRRDVESMTLACLKSAKASSHLRILERGKELIES